MPPQSLKGVSGDVIVLEEAAYCDPGLISEVIIPLLSMQSSCLMCISTLLESGNHYSKMFELTDATGEKLFETISISLVCDDCMKTEHPEKCTHKLAEMPRWLSSAKMEVVRSLLADDPAMLLRESMGVSADSTQRAFPSEDIERFFERVYPRFPADGFSGAAQPLAHFTLAVDPAAGGSSQFAVFSLAQLATGTIICLGGEAMRTKDVRETHKLVIAHIHAVRASAPELAQATAVLVLESNLAFEAQHLMHALNTAHVSNWVALSEGAAGSVGWLTTNERKEAMCMQLRDALRVGCIGLHGAFVCQSAPAAEVLSTLRDEMRNFCVIVDAAKTPFSRARKTYSGKVGGRNDDLVICVQLALTGTRCFFQSDKYSAFRAR